MAVTRDSFIADIGKNFSGLETPGLIEEAIGAEVLKVKAGDPLTDELVKWRVARRLAAFENKEFIAECDTQIAHLTVLMAAGGLEV